MDRDPQAQGDESTTESRRHVENAAENRDALEAQAQRTRATAPASTDAPVDRAAASGSARDSDNASAARQAQENRDALEEQNRRVAATAPDEVDVPGPGSSWDRNTPP